jgi:DNA-binding LacI/PurR family transcriptional regulator
MVSIKDVAKRAGVSVSTVSRCLNGYPDVNGKTKEHILQIVMEMNYIPNKAAQSIVQKNTYMVGLTIPDIMDSYFAENAAGAEDLLRKNGFKVLYGSLARSKDRFLEFLHLSQQLRLDGLIITPDYWDEDIVKAIKNIETPMVALRRRPPEELDIPYVDTDHYKGARQMTQYLIGIGHKKIVHIAFPSVIGKERLRGYHDEMVANGLEPVFFTSDATGRMHQSIESGHRSMEEIYKTHPDSTAVFAGSDLLAMGVIECLNAIGRRVPEDISVTGIDNLEYADFDWFKLTTMALKRREMGEKAALMLVKMMKAQVKRPQSVLFDSDLIIRESAISLAK